MLIILNNVCVRVFFFFKQKTAYEMRISDWSSDVCSSDLRRVRTFSRASQDRIADLGALISETLGAMKIVQALTQESREAERLGGAVERAFGTARMRVAIRAVMTAIVSGMSFGAIVLVIGRKSGG